MHVNLIVMEYLLQLTLEPFIDRIYLEDINFCYACELHNNEIFLEKTTKYLVELIQNV